MTLLLDTPVEQRVACVSCGKTIAVIADGEIVLSRRGEDHVALQIRIRGDVTFECHREIVRHGRFVLCRTSNTIHT